jgi:hypothetical protein
MAWFVTAIHSQDRIDHPQQRTQLRLARRRRPRVAGRQREPTHLRYRLSAQTKHTRRFTLAAALHKKQTDEPLRKPPRQTSPADPKAISLPPDGFYSAALSNMPALQWPGLSPPCTPHTARSEATGYEDSSGHTRRGGCAGRSGLAEASRKGWPRRSLLLKFTP